LFVDKGPIAVYGVAVRGRSFPESTKAIRCEFIIGIEPEDPLSAGTLDGSIHRIRLSRIWLTYKAQTRVSVAVNDSNCFVV
jgi:hypothetical protein